MLTALYRFSLNETLSMNTAIILSSLLVALFSYLGFQSIATSIDLLDEYDELKYEEMKKDK